MFRTAASSSSEILFSISLFRHLIEVVLWGFFLRMYLLEFALGKEAKAFFSFLFFPFFLFLILKILHYEIDTEKKWKLLNY